jgi:hypothetical protein
MPKKVRVKTEEETNLLADIKKDWRIIKYMENPSMLLIKAAIKAGSVYAVEAIAHKYMTPELATYIVEREIQGFKFIPDEFKTPELSLKAVWSLFQSKHRKSVLWQITSLQVRSGSFQLNFVPKKSIIPQLKVV